ncbi:MAG TPA: VOC family protein [Mesorhizobium sp.]|jgi:catechol 2,3-dioxygenase-like lactoylglutathione lyase family enzyme|uniref:VOC family protein n=1 Tax=Mesorhizobium sp. TaxID=1871066 RepID=UPI002DDD1D6F|nr:VOC family protein [Mesorhizobium sp.]HEV2506333.1 VOC family protein [Mesorhizobium sp.]
MHVIFRGIFLTSTSPARTADFYRRVAGLPLEQVGAEGSYIYWRIDRDGIQLAIHAAEAFAAYTHPPLAGSNLTHLYFKIDDREGFLARLKELAIEPFAVDDVVVTVEDPDGRKVMFGTA